MNSPEMKTILVSGVGDIDPERLANFGAQAVLFDADSTVHPRKKPEHTYEEAIEFVEGLRSFDISVALVTNSRSSTKNAITCGKLGLEKCFSPDGFGYKRKPSPDLALAACYELGVDPAKVAMVGDKRTLDGKSARRAGLPLFFWVDRLGREDHIGDRLFRRPIREWPARQVIKMSNLVNEVVSDIEADFAGSR